MVFIFCPKLTFRVPGIQIRSVSELATLGFGTAYERFLVSGMDLENRPVTS